MTGRHPIHIQQALDYLAEYETARAELTAECRALMRQVLKNYRMGDQEAFGYHSHELIRLMRRQQLLRHLAPEPCPISSEGSRRGDRVRIDQEREEA